MDKQGGSSNKNIIYPIFFLYHYVHSALIIKFIACLLCGNFTVFYYMYVLYFLH